MSKFVSNNDLLILDVRSPSLDPIPAVGINSF